MSYKQIVEAYHKVINQTIESLDEELTDAEKRKADLLTEYNRNSRLDTFHSSHPKAKELFDASFAAGELKHRARVPLKLLETAAVPHPDVSRFIKDQGYHFTPEEYKAGIANETKTVGNPEMGIPYSTKTVQHKIGRLLDKHSATNEMKQKFMNDPFRVGARTKEYDLIVTAHPHDIVGGSTGRGWTSCADIRPRPPEHPLGSYDGKGPAAKALPDEIKHFTHMVYIVPRGGNVDTDAIARTSYKLHRGLKTGHETLFPESRVYVTAPQGFKESADKLMSQLFQHDSSEVYKKHSNVYDDNNQPYVFGTSKPTAEQMDLVAKSQPRGSKDAMRHLYKHMDPSHKYKTKLLKSANVHLTGLINAVNSNDPNKFLHALHAAQELDSVVSPDGYYASNNPHIEEAANKLKDSVDISNPKHVSAIIQAKRSEIARKLLKHSVLDKEAKTYQEYKNMFDLSQHGIMFANKSRIPIAKRHDMGKNPFHTILSGALKEYNMQDDEHVKEAAKLAREAFISTDPFRSKSAGNIYDHLIDAENSNVHGVSGLIDHFAKRNVKFASQGYTLNGVQFGLHDELAKTLIATKPANRERLADAFNIGMTAKEIIKKGKAGVDEIRNYNKLIKQAKQQKDRLGLTESFDLDDIVYE